MAIGDTIVAQATPPGRSALAVIRVSGAESETLLNAIFGVELESHRARLAKYQSLAGEILDEVIVLPFEKGRSFTGEASFEITCHGNPVIVDQIIDDLVTRGARLAEPGEFTRNAFLNGRIDLTQAEAIAELISSQSDRELEMSRRQLAGEVTQKVQAFTGQLVSIIARIEAYIDFPEEDLPPEDQDGPVAEIKRLAAEVSSLAVTRKQRAQLQGGLRLVLTGAPNAGKSSLFNAIVGKYRAIVDVQPGTTRDYIEAELNVDGYRVLLVDTAGVREGKVGVEAEGIRRSGEQIQEADIVLYVVDSSDPLFVDDEVQRLVRDSSDLYLVEGKSDLKRSGDLESWLPTLPRFRVSAKTNEGVRDVVEKTLHNFVRTSEAEEARVWVNARQGQNLENAVSALERSLAVASTNGPIELIVSELREALDALGEISGSIDNEAILDEVFSTFCIGK